MKLYCCFVFFTLIVPLWSWSCWWSRCCPEKENIIEGLEKNVTASLFGQHLVNEPIVAAISFHLNQPNPQKALVLSFNGPPGVGKTYVARMIAHHVFNGETYYVKFYSGANDFQDSNHLAEHKAKLFADIKNTVSKCAYSIFIFDECDRMSDSLFDVLKPFIDYYDEYQGIDFRRTIFIFMSNIGGTEISRICFNNLINKQPREALTLQNFEDVLTKWLFNKPGGLKDSTLLQSFLIDWYIPFLPLEKKHIEECIHLALKENGVQPTGEIVRYIYELLPKRIDNTIEYVPSNCKKIHQEVAKYKHILDRRHKQRTKDEM